MRTEQEAQKLGSVFREHFVCVHLCVFVYVSVCVFTHVHETCMYVKDTEIHTGVLGREEYKMRLEK